MKRAAIAAFGVVLAACGGIPMAHCERDPRRYRSDILHDCEDCDGGREVCVARSAADIARWDRERAACEATPGARWDGVAEACR